MNFPWEKGIIKLRQPIGEIFKTHIKDKWTTIVFVFYDLCPLEKFSKNFIPQKGEA